MTALLIALLLSAPEPRPEWWRASALRLDAGGLELTANKDGSVTFPAPAYAAAMGMLEQCREYPGRIDLNFAQLWAYHSAVVAETRSDADFRAQSAHAEAQADIDARWSPPTVAIVAVGAGALGVIVGGLLVLGQQAISE